MRLRRHGKDEDPTISTVDYEEARDRGKILYLENKYEDADILDIHNGANVFIRHRGSNLFGLAQLFFRVKIIKFIYQDTAISNCKLLFNKEVAFGRAPLQ